MAFGASTRTFCRNRWRNRPAARGSLPETDSASGPRQETGGRPGRGVLPGPLPQPASWGPEPRLTRGGCEGEPVGCQAQGLGLGTEAVAVLGQMGPGRTLRGCGQGTCAYSVMRRALRILSWRKRQTNPKRGRSLQTERPGGCGDGPATGPGPCGSEGACGHRPASVSSMEASIRVHGRGAQMLQKRVV